MTLNLANNDLSYFKNHDIERSELDLKGQLIASNRKLKALPSAFLKCHLCDIRYIDISNNRFPELPRSISQCVYLETLLCSHNILRIAPDWLTQLTFISFLDLSHNSLSCIPHGMVALTSLKVLHMQNNKINSFPNDVCGLVYLSELDLSHNIISSLPQRICQLQSLRVLRLKNNLLDRLNPDISSLQLRVLDVSSNRLQILPHQMHHMETLEELRVDSNPLLCPPSVICVKGLRHIMKYLLVESIRDPERKQKTDSPQFPLPADSLYYRSTRRNKTDCVGNAGRVGPYSNGVDSGFGSSSTVNIDAAFPAAPISHKHSYSTPSSASASPRSKEASPASAHDSLLHHTDAAKSSRSAVNVVTPNSNSNHTYSQSHVKLESKTQCAASSSRVQFTSSQSVLEMLQTKSARLNAPINSNRLLKSSSFTTTLPCDESKPEHLRRLDEPYMQERTAAISSRRPSQPSLPVEPPHESHARRPSQPAPLAPAFDASLCRPSMNSIPEPDPCHLSHPDNALLLQMKLTIDRRLGICLPDSLDGLVDALKDGVVLCYLANQIAPQSISSIHVPAPGTGQLPLPKSRRNVESFLSLCRKIGLPSSSVFMFMDMMSGKRGLLRISRTVMALDDLSLSKSPS